MGSLVRTNGCAERNASGKRFNQITLSFFFLLTLCPSVSDAKLGNAMSRSLVQYPRCGKQSKPGQKCSPCLNTDADGCICNTNGQCVAFCATGVYGKPCTACSTAKTDGCACDFVSGRCVDFCAANPNGATCRSCNNSSGAGCICSKGRCIDTCQGIFNPLKSPKCTACKAASKLDGCVCSAGTGKSCVPFCQQASPYKLLCKGCVGGECQCSGGSCLPVCAIPGNNGKSCHSCTKLKGGTCSCKAGKCSPDTTCQGSNGVTCTTCSTFALDGSCSCQGGLCRSFCSLSSHSRLPCKSCSSSLASLYGECACSAGNCIDKCSLAGQAGKPCKSCPGNPNPQGCTCNGGVCKDFCAITSNNLKSCSTCSEFDSDGCLCYGGTCSNFCAAPSSKGKACSTCSAGAPNCVCGGGRCIQK